MLTKIYIVKAMVFPVVMYECETWTIKEAFCLRIDTFKLWCWTRLLRVPETARKSNHSVLKEINPEYSLEGLMLKLQHFNHLIRDNTLEKTLMLGNTECRSGQQRMRWLVGITDSVDMSLSKLGNGEGQGSLRCCSSWGLTYLAAPGLSSGSCSMHTVQLWHMESRSLTRD